MSKRVKTPTSLTFQWAFCSHFYQLFSNQHKIILSFLVPIIKCCDTKFLSHRSIMRRKRLKILKNVLNKSGLDLFFTPIFMWTLFVFIKRNIVIAVPWWISILPRLRTHFLSGSKRLVQKSKTTLSLSFNSNSPSIVEQKCTSLYATKFSKMCSDLFFYSFVHVNSFRFLKKT